MKLRAFSFLLIFLFSLPFMMKVGVLVHWKINQARITQLYCINKDKPRLHCDGKCYLAQKMQQIEAKQMEAVRSVEHPIIPIEKLAKTEFSPFILGKLFSLTSAFRLVAAAPAQAQKGGIYAFFYDFDALKAHFQPPEII